MFLSPKASHRVSTEDTLKGGRAPTRGNGCPASDRQDCRVNPKDLDAPSLLRDADADAPGIWEDRWPKTLAH